MTQNQNMTYQNMINYPINIPSLRSRDQINYNFQQPQLQRALYPYTMNPAISPNQNSNPNITVHNIQNIQSNTIQDNSSTKTDSISAHNNSFTPLKLLTKYKDIYVPSIYLLDYNDINQSPFNILSANQSQILTPTYNPIVPIMNNNQNNNILNKYLNYGYNFEQWKIYVNEIKAKFDELNDLVKNGNIRLPDPENELEYLMAFPSDYGGLGNVQNDQYYENVKFYDPKDTTKNQGNKNFMSLIKFEHDQTWFPLDPSSLNKQFNDINKIINPPVNTYMKFFYQPNFFIRNPNSNNSQNTVISINTEQIGINGNNGIKLENEKNEKER